MSKPITPDEFDKFIDNYMCGKGKHTEAKRDYRTLYEYCQQLEREVQQWKDCSHATLERKSKQYDDFKQQLAAKEQEIADLNATINAITDLGYYDLKEQIRAKDELIQRAVNYVTLYDDQKNTHKDCHACQWLADASKVVK